MSRPPPPLPDPEAYPFHGRYLSAGHCRLHLLDEGGGPPLLMLHGNPGWSFLYRHLVRELSGHFRCLVPDLPGFGLSAPPSGWTGGPGEHAAILERLVLDLDLRGVLLLGQEWGGAIGLDVATRHPRRFAGLALAGTFAWPLDHDRAVTWRARLLGGPVGRLLTVRLPAGPHWSLLRAIHRRPLPDAVLAAYHAPLATPDSRRAVWALAGAPRAQRGYLHLLESRLGRLAHLPALLLRGEHDRLVGAAEMVRFQRVFPYHRSQVVTGAGHFLPEDAPVEVAALLTEWWRAETEGAHGQDDPAGGAGRPAAAAGSGGGRGDGDRIPGAGGGRAA